MHVLNWGGKSESELELKRIADYIWEIPKSGGMRVPARVFASEQLLEKIKQDATLTQARNMCYLPGIYKYAIAMPDAHQGYGFPVGGVAALDAEEAPGAYKDLDMEELRSFIDGAIEAYNRYRSPEAVAKLVKLDKNRLILEISGPYCRSCWLSDWFSKISRLSSPKSPITGLNSPPLKPPTMRSIGLNTFSRRRP